MDLFQYAGIDATEEWAGAPLDVVKTAGTKLDREGYDLIGLQVSMTGSYHMVCKERARRKPNIYTLGGCAVDYRYINPIIVDREQLLHMPGIWGLTRYSDDILPLPTSHSWTPYMWVNSYEKEQFLAWHAEHYKDYKYYTEYGGITPC